MNPYPLLFEPILMPKVWGGRRLAHLGKSLPTGANFGESWELADLGATSASGGGGAAARSVIANGPLAGRSLHEAMALWGTGLLGALSPTPSGDFPLLVKFLDAREHLSVQVHPSEAYAQAHPSAHLKTECWYIIEAQATAGTPPLIFKGLKPGVTPRDLRQAIERGEVPKIMASVPAVPGECHNLPSGTIHALGAGVLVAEVQTPSDTTFRIYDWAAEYGRQGRELHIEESLACADFGPAPAARHLPPGATSGRLVSSPYFQLDECVGASSLPPDRLTPAILMIVRGQGSLRSGITDLSLQPGMTILVPASAGASWSGPELRLLLTTFA